MELKEVKKHLGERVYVESKPAYNRYIGTYILGGIMQMCELDKDGKEVWTVQIKLWEINAKNCSIWIDLKGAVIKFVENAEHGNDEEKSEIFPIKNNPSVSCADRSLYTKEPCDNHRTIEDIQKESLEKLKMLCQ